MRFGGFLLKLSGAPPAQKCRYGTSFTFSKLRSPLSCTPKIRSILCVFFVQCLTSNVQRRGRDAPEKSLKSLKSLTPPQKSLRVSFLIPAPIRAHKKIPSAVCWWVAVKTNLTRWMQGRGVTPLLCWESSRNFQKKLKTQISERILGAQENPLRSLLDANEEGIYRSATPKTPPICVF